MPHLGYPEGTMRSAIAASAAQRDKVSQVADRFSIATENMEGRKAQHVFVVASEGGRRATRRSIMMAAFDLSARPNTLPPDSKELSSRAIRGEGLGISPQRPLRRRGHGRRVRPSQRNLGAILALLLPDGRYIAYRSHRVRFESDAGS